MSHCKVVRACRRGCLARRRRVYQRTTHPHPPLAFTDFFASLFALPLFALPTSTDAAHPPPHPPPLRLPSRHRRIADACRLAHTTLHPPRRVAGPRRPPPPPLPASTHAVASRTDPRCKPPYLTLTSSSSSIIMCAHTCTHTHTHAHSRTHACTHTRAHTHARSTHSPPCPTTTPRRPHWQRWWTRPRTTTTTSSATTAATTTTTTRARLAGTWLFILLSRDADDDQGIRRRV